MSAASKSPSRRAGKAGWLVITVVLAACAAGGPGPAPPPSGDIERLEQSARAAWQQQRRDEAITLAMRALQRRVDSAGPNDPQTAIATNNAGFVMLQAGRYEQATELLRAAVARFEAAFGRDDPRVATPLNNLASAHHHRAAYDDAQAAYGRAIGLLRTAAAPDEQRVALLLNNLGALEQARGRYAAASEHFEAALAIRRRLLPPDSPDLAVSLSNLGVLYRQRGQTERAGRAYREALSIQRRILAGDDLAIAKTLNNLGSLQQHLGDYRAAEQSYGDALGITIRAVGENHREVAAPLGNLAELYRERGDHVRALVRQHRARDILVAALGPDHPDVARADNNLAASYEAIGDIEQARELYTRALRSRERSLGPEAPDVAVSLANLAALLARERRTAEALELAQRVIAIRMKTLGPDHPDVALAINNLASTWQTAGEPARAEKLYELALPILLRSVGDTHPQVAAVHENLSTLHWAQGQPVRALQAAREAARIRETLATRVLGSGSQAQKRLYLETLDHWADYLISLHLDGLPDDPGAAELALLASLRRKGRALDAAVEQLAVGRREGGETAALFEELADVRAQLARLAVADGSAGIGSEERLRLQLRIQRLESDIANHGPTALQRIDDDVLRRMRAALPADAALIEFLSYRRFQPAEGRFGEPRYAACVLRRDGPPRFHDLGPAGELDDAADEFAEALADRLGGVDRLGRSLDEKLLQPLVPALSGVRHLLISADRALNLLPFAALIDRSGEPRLERFTISYLTSGRDLERLARDEPVRGPAVVVANPVFDIAPDDGASATDTATEGAGGSGTGGGSGGAGTADAARPDGGARHAASGSARRWQPLPGSADEARELARLLPDARVMLAERATEGALKRLAGPRLLHIATHGFFNNSPAEATRFDEPLLQGGLALAGANLRRGGAGEDGVLTALEAAGLDLHGTRLVVLSACESGVGESGSHEGVYGLRRAFVLAGARAQLTSLWQVDDHATRDLMIATHRRLANGEPLAHALAQAQRAMRRHSGRAHPYYWASFIPVGDWRAIRTGR